MPGQGRYFMLRHHRTLRAANQPGFSLNQNDGPNILRFLFPGTHAAPIISVQSEQAAADAHAGHQENRLTRPKT